ncbi:hypothetical protein J6590_044657 [Homalodisca vitripennis]|nr:hypothetical protein J6590_044657 [Homalodisca vitripennis]
MCAIYLQFSSLASSFRLLTSQAPHLTPSISLSTCELRDESVCRRSASLDGPKGCGPDDIQLSVRLSCFDLLTPCQTTLFNSSLHLGAFPSVLKEGFIVSIPRNSTASDAGDLQQNFTTEFVQRVPGGCLYLDYAKAFDRIDHPILEKLKGGYQYLDAPCALIAFLVGLSPPRLHREIVDIYLLYKLLSGYIDCLVLLLSLQIRIPFRTRSQALFANRSYPTSYQRHAAISRLI